MSARKRPAWQLNRCAVCGRFVPWEDLVLYFIPDSPFSSEDDSWRECYRCLDKRKRAVASRARASRAV